MLKKAYLEITNVCNLNCSFCHGTSRKKVFMSVADFRKAASALRPHTQYLYLHLMGEPLLHPELPALLGICRELKFKTAITTNGTLIKEKEEILLNAQLYKISISLHSFEANGDADHAKPERYVTDICSFAEKASAKGTIISLRLWNGNGQNRLNDRITDIIRTVFHGEYKTNRLGLTLAENIFLEYGEKFDWPDINAPEKDVHFCMGLRDHIGVLADGTVVPCCLDADGKIPLGNIFTESLDTILTSPKAKAIYDGFTEHTAKEELCRRCGYAERFG